MAQTQAAWVGTQPSPPDSRFWATSATGCLAAGQAEPRLHHQAGHSHCSSLQRGRRLPQLRCPPAPPSVASHTGDIEEDRSLCATSRETQSGLYKCAVGVSGMQGDVVGNISQQEVCLEAEVMGRGVSTQ